MSTIDNGEFEGVTIDGQQVEEITADGDVVWTATEIIDDFERGNRSGWTVPGSTGSDSVVSPGLGGTTRKWRHNGFREAHLSGANAQDRGPQPGDTFEFWFHITSASGSVINRFEFSADGVNDTDCYRIEYERGTGANEFSLEKIAGGSQAKVSTHTGHSVSVGTTYRCEVEWNDGNNNITARLYLVNGNTASNKLSISDNSSTSGGEFTQPGVAIRTNANNNCFYDELRIP